MKSTKWMAAALAVAGCSIVVNSVQAQGISGTPYYLSNVTPNATGNNALYNNMATNTTFLSGPSGLTISSAGEGAFYYVLPSGTVYGALAHPELVTTFTVTSPLTGGSAAGDYLGYFVQVGDNNGASATYGGYSGPGNTVNGPDTVWNGNTATDTEPLTGSLLTSMEAGGDAIYSFTFTFNNTASASAPYDITLNSIAIQSAPEPSSLALMGLGAVGLFFLLRRKTVRAAAAK